MGVDAVMFAAVPTELTAAEVKKAAVRMASRFSSGVFYIDLELWGHLERRMQWLAANLSAGRGKRKRKLYELWMRRVTDELTRRRDV